MKIIFLGTGTSQGVPVIGCDCKVCQSDDPRDKRLRSSVLIEIDDLIFVIDTGPDFRQQMLKEHVNKLDAIFMTHSHKDHVAGLDDVRAFNFKTKLPVDLYAEKEVQDVIRQEFAYVFADHKYPGIPRINMHMITNEKFAVNGVEIIPIRAIHYKLPVLGFRIGDFVYITDTNHIPDSEMKKLSGVSIFVVNALRKEMHISHFCLEEALDVTKKINPLKAYFTHMSHDMGKHSDVQAELPENVFLAYDGLKLEL